MAWRAATLQERDFFQGLVHVAVAWYQAGRGNHAGCDRQLEKAQRRLGPYAPRHRDLELGPLLDRLAEARASVAGGDLALPEPFGPGESSALLADESLDVLEADPLERPVQENA